MALKKYIPLGDWYPVSRERPCGAFNWDYNEFKILLNPAAAPARLPPARALPTRRSAAFRAAPAAPWAPLARGNAIPPATGHFLGFFCLILPRRAEIVDPKFAPQGRNFLGPFLRPTKLV